MTKQPGRDGLPDWRDPEAYRFECLDRAGFAWEWLRRDPEYRAAARAAPGTDRAGLGPAHADARAACWGLVAFERPDRAAPAARPMWSAAVDREVLLADAAIRSEADPDAFVPDGLGDLACVALADNAAHWLFTDGWRRLRIDLVPATPVGVAIEPSWRLAGVHRLSPQLVTLRRLLSLIRSGRFASRLWPRDPRARRWILALRAHDALAAGAGHRGVAELLEAGGISAGRWRVHHSSIRLQAQRLAALSRALPGRRFADRYLG